MWSYKFALGCRQSGFGDVLSETCEDTNNWAPHHTMSCSQEMKATAIMRGICVN